MLRDICQRIEVLNNYCEVASVVFIQSKQACFEIALVLLSFVFEVIKFIRQDGEYSASGESISG